MRRARKGSASPTSESAAATQMQLQGAFAPGGAQSQDVVESDEDAVPAQDARPAPEPTPPSEFVPATATSPQEIRALAKPPVRKLAKDLGVDLASVTATGPNGTVTRADVEKAAKSSAGAAPARGAAAPRATASSGERETREPVKGVRKMMANAMVSSAFTAPHVTEWVTIESNRPLVTSIP